MKPVQYQSSRFENRFDRVLDEVFNREIGSFFGSDGFASEPLVNITEHAGAYCIEIAAPGLVKQDFNIQAEGHFLTVSAQRKQEKEDQQEGKILRKEFNFATFSRRFRLPNGTVAENIEAVYAHGVLTTNIPKSEPELQKHRSVAIQ